MPDDEDAIARLADAMAEEFAASLPTDEPGWAEAAQRIAERVERES